MPKTTVNFASLCMDNVTYKANTDSTKKLAYKNSKFFRAVKGYGLFGGDFLNNDGTAGESIYGMTYRDESFEISHDSRYLLSITKPRATPHTSNSQFMIALSPLKWLDYRYQVFGRVAPVSQPLVDKLESDIGTKAWDQFEPPLIDVKVTNCSIQDPDSWIIVEPVVSL
ncbi:peptidylprolyl isomerase a [Stylonychia lemnae]|uniref:Peptidylprolyl isomerase a n=1 Tax=Stylonychia lemnae TaxID=5949 RepID=A0A077ZQM0_STYLE|nr:peptidylprolyl isomerase a [Stylonychia lemnae]|eukprot:CDW72207.1 peptidylprolyl isomerase a [Stylonychia lemnae]